jgi:hypothetical protein
VGKRFDTSHLNNKVGSGASQGEGTSELREEERSRLNVPHVFSTPSRDVLQVVGYLVL